MKIVEQYENIIFDKWDNLEEYILLILTSGGLMLNIGEGTCLYISLNIVGCN